MTAAFLGYTFLHRLRCSYTTFNEKKTICCLLWALEELISSTLHPSLTRLSFMKLVQCVLSQSLPNTAQQGSRLDETLEPIKAYSRASSLELLLQILNTTDAQPF